MDREPNPRGPAPAGRRARLRHGLVLVAALLGLLVTTSTANAATAISSPRTNATYVNMVPVTFSLGSTPVAGSEAIVLTGPAGTTTLGLSGSATTGSLSITGTDVATTGSIASVSGPTDLPDGTYALKVSYTAATGGATVTSSTITFTLSDQTAPPTLTEPSTGEASSNPIAVAYTLPSVPAFSPGSVTLTFANDTASYVLTLTGTQVADFSFNPADPTASPDITAISGGSSIPDGTYTVTVSYSDDEGHAAATAVSTDVTVDTVTQTPTLTGPTTGAVDTGSFPVAFTLPETPLGGSVELMLQNSVDSYSLTLGDTTSGQHSLTLDPADPTDSPDVLAVTGGASIAPGTYTVAIGYQDALGNAAATASVSGVTVGACGAGSYSATGLGPCTTTSPGYYVSTVEATTALACPTGFYQPATGASDCLAVDPGSYAPTAAGDELPCPTGSYCPALSTAPTPCPAGSACAAGAATPTLCGPGFFASGQGNSVCEPADPGDYVPWSGATTELACNAGTYAAETGSTACTPADPGSYIPFAEASGELPCPAGFTTTAPGQTSCTSTASADPAPAPTSGDTTTGGAPTTGGTTSTSGEGPTTDSPGSPGHPTATADLITVRTRLLPDGCLRVAVVASYRGAFTISAGLRGPGARRWASYRPASARISRRTVHLLLSPGDTWRPHGALRHGRLWLGLRYVPAAGGRALQVTVAVRATGRSTTRLRALYTWGGTSAS